MTGTAPVHDETAAHSPTNRVYEVITALSMTVGRGSAARMIADLAEVSGGDHVVDVGCGPGTAVREAAHRGATAIGVDPTPLMLRLGRRITAVRHVRNATLVEGTAETLPLPDACATIVWALSSAHHWADRAAGLSEARRVLAPGGQILIAERLVQPGTARSWGARHHTRPSRHGCVRSGSRQLRRRPHRHPARETPERGRRARDSTRRRVSESGPAADGRRKRPPTAVLVVLSAGPKTLVEIEDAFRGFGRRVPGDSQRYRGGRNAGAKLGPIVEAAVARTVAAGWTARDADGDRFGLTEAGRAAADRVLAGLHARRTRLHGLLRPVTAATTTLGIQVAITAIKVPAALLSRSAAELNDAAEEVVDVIGSIIVSVGVRVGRERVASFVVVALMLGTGCFTLAIALRRFFVPFTPTVSWYPLTVAVISVPVYVLRSAYERSAGQRGDSVALISQSVDSRNHALASLAVTVGLVAVGLQVTAVDTVIGLALALTILRSGVSLARDRFVPFAAAKQSTCRADSLWVTDRVERMIQTRLETWLLYLVEAEHVTNRTELRDRVHAATNPATNPLLRGYGMELDTAGNVESALVNLVQRDLLCDGDQLAVTDAGRSYLRHAHRRY